MQYVELETANKQLLARVKELVSTANSLYNKHLQIPGISWQPLPHLTIARTYPMSNSIIFNTNYLHSPDFPTKMYTVLIHEYCHILNYVIHNSHGHNSTFRKLCSSFGISGSSTMEIEHPTNFKGYIFRCSCGNLFHVQTHRKYLSYIRGKYVCSDCNTNLSKAELIQVPPSYSVDKQYT